MSATGEALSNELVCSQCGGPLIEMARENHPRLPAHEIRAYACRLCGAQEKLNAPVPIQKGMP